MVTVICAATIFLGRPKALLCASNIEVHIAAGFHRAGKVAVGVDDVHQVGVTGVKPRVDMREYWHGLHLHQTHSSGRPIYPSRIEACDPLHLFAPAFLQLVGQEATDMSTEAVTDAMQGGFRGGELLEEEGGDLGEAPGVLN